MDRPLLALLASKSLERYWPKMRAQQITLEDLCRVQQLQGRAALYSVLQDAGVISVVDRSRLLNPSP